jgi:hypothetical protein
MEKKDYISVQMIQENNKILKNLSNMAVYPHLYDEIYEHDKWSHTSWYKLSPEAYREYQEWLKRN